MRAASPGAARLLVLALTVVGCGDVVEAPEPSAATPLARLLVVGIDGLEWSVLRPLMEQGRCPNFRALMEAGSFGRLATLIPTHSPVLWTTIATGKSMQQHEITGFLDAQMREFTSSRRRGRALWNIASEYGLTTNVFGWWITWPAEAIRGVMVSSTSAGAEGAKETKTWKGALMPGLDDQVHPPELTDRVMDVARRVGEPARVAELARERVFGVLPEDGLSEVEREQVSQTLWSLMSDETYYRVALEVGETHPADLTLVYFSGPDVAGHRFWRAYRPEEFAYAGSSPEADAALGRVIPNYYEWVDEMVGELVAAAGEGVTTFVVSDHGMHAIARDEPNARRTSGGHEDAPPGVLIAAGPGVVDGGGVDAFLESGELPVQGSVLAVAPTLLGLLGVPGARDMKGRVHFPLLTPEVRSAVRALGLVETHDEGFREPTVVEVPADKEREFIDRMAALGYLDVAPDHDGESILVDPDAFDRAADDR